jgi:hypothetical protein
MGASTVGGADQAIKVLAGAFTAPAVGLPICLNGDFNFSIWGAFTGSVSLERSFDGGVSWLNISVDLAGTDNAFIAPITSSGTEPEGGVLYHFNCTALSAGTANWRLSS